MSLPGPLWMGWREAGGRALVSFAHSQFLTSQRQVAVHGQGLGTPVLDHVLLWSDAQRTLRTLTIFISEFYLCFAHFSKIEGFRDHEASP